MTQTEIIVAIVVIVVLLLLVAAFSARQRQQRSERLRQQFGPEYERTVRDVGNRGRAEQALEARQQRVSQLDIRPLDERQRATFADRWRAIQARFVDEPVGAVADADALVGEAMQARGYPVADFEQRAADVSVDHPNVVQHYRAAHDVARRQLDGRATTEELRRAMVDYRALFDEIVGSGDASATGAMGVGAAGASGAVGAGGGTGVAGASGATGVAGASRATGAPDAARETR